MFRRRTLKTVEAVEAPDTTEKYQAHAYWALMFHCDCGAGLDLPENLPIFSKAYFEQMALDAKNAGWTVPELKDANSMPEMICFCPACSEKNLAEKS